VDRSTWINRAIETALKGIVVFDRTKGPDHVDLAYSEESADAA
jgi:hypothetical protein